jgi:DNA-binding IclR family transcriptional regulator
MEQNSINNCFNNGALSKELLALLETGTAGLTIIELARKLSLTRKETLLLLVTLESQGVLTWDETAKIYRPDLHTLSTLLHGAMRPHTRNRRDKVPRVQKLAKAA